MPPIVALILCTIFVLFLLRLDRKQYPDASFALWIPVIWMLLNASKPLGVWFGVVGISMEEGSVLDRNVLSGLLLLGLIILAKRKFNWSSFIKENIWVMLLLGFMLISVFWSDMPYSSFKRWTRSFIAVVMALIVASEADPRQALQCIFRKIIYILIPFSLVLIKYYPHLGVEYGRWSGELMWVGVESQKNGLALLCLFAFFFLMWTFIRRWQGRDIPVVWYQTYAEVLLLMLTIWLFSGPQHTLTYSATSTAALAVGLTALIGLVCMKKRGILIGSSTLTVIIVLIIVYGTITPFVGGLKLYDPSAILGRDQTLTGRSEIWKYLVPYAMDKPILGHGFGGFWTDAHREASSSHAHNGYLDIILNLGFCGLLLISMYLVSACRKAREEMTRDFDWGVLWFCFLLMAVVHNIAESSTISFTGLLPAVILFFLISSNSNHVNSHIVLPEAKKFAAQP